MHHDAAGYPTFPGAECSTMFGPDELNKLERIFDYCATECHFPPQSERAHSLGRSLIRLYTDGEHNEAILRSILLVGFRRHSC